jgi:hypothetical protein
VAAANTAGLSVDLAKGHMPTRTPERVTAVQFGGMRVLLRELPAGGWVDALDGFNHLRLA